MFDAFPAGSTSVFTMRSPGLLGTPTKAVGLFTPPQTTALVTSHLPFLAGSASSQPLKSLPFSKGFHPLSVRNGGSPWSLPSFAGGRSAAATSRTKAAAKAMAAATPTRKCLTSNDYSPKPSAVRRGNLLDQQGGDGLHEPRQPASAAFRRASLVRRFRAGRRLTTRRIHAKKPRCNLGSADLHRHRCALCAGEGGAAAAPREKRRALCPVRRRCPVPDAGRADQ